MGSFEYPELHASAEQFARINYLAAITAIWKKVGFGQPDSYLAPKPRFFVSASNIFGLAGILFKRQLCDLFASPVAQVGCGLSVRRILSLMLGVASRGIPADPEFLEAA